MEVNVNILSFDKDWGEKSEKKSQNFFSLAIKTWGNSVNDIWIWKYLCFTSKPAIVE